MDTLTRFEQKEDLAYPYSPNFAELNRDVAVSIYTFNAELTGMTVGNVDDFSEAKLAAANDEAVQKAVEQNIGKATTLVGYDYDAAFPTLIRGLLPSGSGLKGFVLAAIFGAVVSSLASMLNSSSTIFTMDIFRKLKKDASQFTLVTVGRICVVVFVLVAMIIAPMLDDPKFGGIFTFIQEFQGFISPGILAIFLFGVLVHKAPRACGTVGLILNPILYGGLKLFAPGIAFLNRMAICFFVVLAVLTIMRLAMPMEKPVELPVNKDMNLDTTNDVKIWGAGVIVLTLVLYAIFW
jgi:SSS family solute:Na+ symporter